MKKIMILLAIVGSITFTSCTGPEGPPGRNGLDGAVPLAFEIKDNFTFSTLDGYTISYPFSKYLDGDLFQDESVLIYRLVGTNNNGSDIWKLIPNTIYFSNGDELTYDYSFSKERYTIFVGGDVVASNNPSYINNQVFRFVIIPSNLSASVNKNSLSEVMGAVNLKENQVKKVEF